LVNEIDLGNVVIRDLDSSLKELANEMRELRQHIPDVSETAADVPKKTRRRKPLDAARNEIILALMQEFILETAEASCSSFSGLRWPSKCIEAHTRVGREVGRPDIKAAQSMGG
jgi:hypothetical protein